LETVGGTEPGKPALFTMRRDPWLLKGEMGSKGAVPKDTVIFGSRSGLGSGRNIEKRSGAWGLWVLENDKGWMFANHSLERGDDEFS